MLLSPKARRNIARIIPFSVIWVVTGTVFILVESAAMGTFNPESETIISLTWSIFAFAMLAVAIVGFLVGTVELLFLENLFRNESFSKKIIYKFGIYTLLMMIIISITYPIAASMEMNLSFFNKQVWEKYAGFLASETFLSTLLQMATSLFLCAIYTVISENLGHNVLVNFLTGRYHRPRQEERIFMFLDMKSSTAFAEQLGHVRYFELLRDYYSDLSNAIINNLGEVYQYIGDEVVITWKSEKGLRNNNCVKCFLAMRKDLKNRESFYNHKFGLVPSFKAGLHMGKVTVGEIGALKKEIFFTGDVLNVTSRIQGLCNEYGTDLLLSADLIEQLGNQSEFEFMGLGETSLKGRSTKLKLFRLEEK